MTSSDSQSPSLVVTLLLPVALVVLLLAVVLLLHRDGTSLSERPPTAPAPSSPTTSPSPVTALIP